METVIVAFSGEKSCARVREILEKSGTAECLVCRSADQVRRTVRQQRVAAVLCGYKFADGTAEELREDLPASCPMLVTASQALLDLVQGERLYKLASPLARGELIDAVEELLRRGAEERELVARAKRRLMERYGLTEEAAHRQLQRLSMERRRKLVQTARAILGE